VAARYGLPRMRRAMADLQDYSEELMRDFIAQIPSGEYSAEDFLDDDGISDDPVRIAVKVSVGSDRQSKSKGNAPVVVDFTGSSRQTRGSVNAVAAITYSACFYVFRCLLQ